MDNSHCKKKKFLDVTTNDQGKRSDLRASTVSLPARNLTHSAVTAFMTPAHPHQSRIQNNNFLQTRSQSCVSMPAPHGRHSIQNSCRPMPILIRDRIVPVPIRFNYSVEKGNLNPKFHSGDQRVSRLIQANVKPNASSIGTGNLNNCRSAFQVLPTKKEILFSDGFNRSNTPQKTLINNYNSASNAQNDKFRLFDSNLERSPFVNHTVVSKPFEEEVTFRVNQIMKEHETRREQLNGKIEPELSEMNVHMKSPSFAEVGACSFKSSKIE